MAEGNSLYAALQKKDQRRNSLGMRISAALFFRASLATYQKEATWSL
jgi:hypothetical protein